MWSRLGALALVVVTLVVAARRELRDLTDVRDAGQMRDALRDLNRLGPGDLVAMEVIWSPSVENDRMSTAELEALYPHLKKLSETSIAGRVFCKHCNGPHAAELAACPHCGVPRGPAAPPASSSSPSSSAAPSSSAPPSPWSEPVV